MKTLILILLMCFSSLSAAETLNPLQEALFTTKEWYFFSDDQNVEISQDDAVVGKVEIRWDLDYVVDAPIFVLKDLNGDSLAYASVYTKMEEPFEAYFEIKNSTGNLLGTLCVLYPSLIPRRPLQAILYSPEGSPLLTDRLESKSLGVYVPGSDHKILDFAPTSYFMPDKQMQVKIVDLDYFTQANISPELYFIYLSIRQNAPSYHWSVITEWPVRKE